MVTENHPIMETDTETETDLRRIFTHYGNGLKRDLVTKVFHNIINASQNVFKYTL